MAKSFERADFSGMTATGGFADSFPFMPREQVINFKRAQPASDVWAMGATCHVILTGASYPGELLLGKIRYSRFSRKGAFPSANEISRSRRGR